MGPKRSAGGATGPPSTARARATDEGGSRSFAVGGKVYVAFSDRSYDPENSMYGTTLAVSTDGGTTFSLNRVDTGLSDPNHSRWFSGRTKGKATFIGDYSGLAMDPAGLAHPIWTDMRNVITLGRTGTTQDVFTTSWPAG